MSGKVPLCCKTVRIWLVYVTSDTSQQGGLQSTTWSYIQDGGPLSNVGLRAVNWACWAKLHCTNSMWKIRLHKGRHIWTPSPSLTRCAFLGRWCFQLQLQISKLSTFRHASLNFSAIFKGPTPHIYHYFEMYIVKTALGRDYCNCWYSYLKFKIWPIKYYWSEII
jgi:hypothetical protein